MYKLTVISGPSKGATYNLQEGESTIGRVDGNLIVLASQKVSKKHCAFVVNSSGISIKDLGSSNGTFVNGALTKQRALKPGDRVSVGEFVFEVTRIAQAAAPRMAVGGGYVAPQFPAQGGGGLPALGQSNPAGGNVLPMFGNGNTGFNAPPGVTGQIGIGQGTPALPAAPKTLKEKIQLVFEKNIINFLYSLNEKQEWRSILIGLFVVLVSLSAVLAVYPVLERTEDKLEEETRYRASFLARLIADRNAPAIYEKTESKIDVGFAEKENGVQGAFVVDMDGRILAPARDLNQYLTEPDKASFSAQARKFFAEQDRTSRFSRRYGDTLAVAEPIRIFSQSSGKNVSVALALIFYDRNLVLFDPGTIALTYIQALILIGIIAVLVFFSVYKLTLKPLTSLNDEVDNALKMQTNSVSRKFKMEEIDPLIEVINATLQRASSGGGGGTMEAGGGQSLSDDVIGAIKFIAGQPAGFGTLMLTPTKKVIYVSSTMEEITGIRNDSSINQDVSAVARDAAFVSLMDDFTSRAATSGMPVQEDFEFSGANYKMECLGVGAGNPKAFLITAAKVE